MTRTLASLALLATLMPLAGFAEEARGPVLLTVVGGTEANRGAVDPDRDVLMAVREIAFDAAFALTLADLRALDQVRVTANAASFEGAVEASGASLDAVLAAAGVPTDATITVSALDGYEAEITPEERAAQTWVVAYEVDGVPLASGGRGPLWVLPDTGGVAVEEGEDANWVWAAYLIVAGDAP